MSAEDKGIESATARLRALLACSLDPVILVDTESRRIGACNRPASTLFARPQDRIIGAGLADLIGETVTEQVVALWEQAPEIGEELRTLALEDLGSEGRRITLGVAREDDLGVLVAHEEPAPQQDDPSPTVRLERGEAEQALREHEVRFRTLADCVPSGIFFTDASGALVYVNERWKQLTRLSLNEAARHGWLDGVHRDDRTRVTEAWRAFIRSKTSFDHKFRLQITPDETRWVAGHAVPFTDNEDRTVGFLGSLADITDLKRAEEDIKSSEEKYRRIFENVLDVYYETSLDGELLEVSPAIEMISGYKQEDVIGKSMLEFYTASGERTAFVEAIMRKGRIYDYEIELKDASGHPVPCSISAKLIYDEDGAPSRIIGSMRDIRERKWTEAILEAERQSLKMIAKDASLPDILENLANLIEERAEGRLCSIWVLDDERRLLCGAAPSLPPEFTQALEAVELGSSAGSSAAAVYSKERIIAQEIATDPSWNKTRELPLKHGLASSWSLPILSSTGAVLGAFTMFGAKVGGPNRHYAKLMDGAAHVASVAIERKLIQRERQDLEEQMRQTQKLESLGVLAGGIAHDFNNLLTGIMGYASLSRHCLRGDQSEATKHIVAIEKVTTRAAELTAQMLAYSGKGKFVVKPMDLSTVVEELAHLLEISISKKARIRYNFAKDLPLIEADAAQLQQLIMNLITNASDALGDDSGDIVISTGVVEASIEYLAESRIEVDLPAGKYVYFEVEDTGCGMDEETISRIFDPFFTTKFTGRGLGMSAVLGIMRGHRGAILIDSTPGVGAVTRLLFPAAHVPAETAPLEQNPETFLQNIDDWQGNGLVLVVDDEEIIRKTADITLGTAGFSVVTANDGEECVERFHEFKDEVVAVLLDLTMPKMDGIQALKEIRKEAPGVPVILSSGFTVQEAEKRLSGQPFQAFIQKPYVRETLLRTMQDVLGAATLEHA